MRIGPSSSGDWTACLLEPKQFPQIQCKPMRTVWGIDYFCCRISGCSKVNAWFPVGQANLQSGLVAWQAHSTQEMNDRPADAPVQGSRMGGFHELRPDAAARACVPACAPSESITASNCRTSGKGAAEVYDDVQKCNAMRGSDLERSCFEQYEKLNWHANFTVKGWVRLLHRSG